MDIPPLCPLKISGASVEPVSGVQSKPVMSSMAKWRSTTPLEEDSEMKYMAMPFESYLTALPATLMSVAQP
ncbi:MAG TPA: hypothetical protein VN888_20755 [Mycobacterium sp.]|nr:hypothetical protein [Mycobacterium sp.]